MKRVKNNQIFLNIEKTKATPVTIKKIEINNKEMENSVEISKELERCFKNLFKRKHRKTKHAYNEFIRDISLPTLSQEKETFVKKKIMKKK